MRERPGPASVSGVRVLRPGDGVTVEALGRPSQYPPLSKQRTGLMRTVADQCAETLAAAGVKRIYGIVGDSLNGLTDAIRRQG